MRTRPAAALASLLLLVHVGPTAWAADDPPPTGDEAGEPKDGDKKDDDDWGDDGDEFGKDPDVKLEMREPSPWALTGFLRTDWGFWAERFDTNPFAKARQNLDLTLSFKKGIVRILLAGHVEYDFAYLAERDSYDQPTLDEYEWQANTREALISFSPGDFELVFGRQIVVWGEGDGLSPLDLVNPRDQREPGMSDLDDIRLPVLAARLSWFHGGHRLEVLATYESDFGYRSPPRGPFSPLDALLGQDPLAAKLLDGKTLEYRDRQCRFSLAQQQYFLRWVYRGQGVDIGAYGAWLLDRQGVILLSETMDLTDISSIMAADTLTLDIDHPRYSVIGHSGAATVDSWLFKWEVGVQINRPLNTGKKPPYDLGSADVQIIDTMLGITWTEVDDLIIALEIHKPWIIDEPDNLLFDAGAPTIMLRASYSTLREDLQFMLVGMMMGWTAELGWIVRGEISYKLIDGLKLSGGYITYQPGDDEFGPFFGLDSHDRIFVKLRWDFRIL